MSCASFMSKPGCISDNSCAPSVALQNRDAFRKLDCCNYLRANHLSASNCCCVAYYYVADDVTFDLRRNTLSSLLAAYALAALLIGWNTFKFYRAFFRSKGTKSLSDVLKTRMFFLISVSLVSLASGACAALFHSRSFNCFGGRGDDPACVGGSSPPAVLYFHNFVASDVAATLSFVVLKMTILRNCLAKVQLGVEPDKLFSDSHNRPRARVLHTAVVLLGLSCLSWIILASLHHVSGQEYDALLPSLYFCNILRRYARDLQGDALSLDSQAQRLQLRFALYLNAAFSLLLANLCAFLYLVHTRHHLNNYLATLHREESVDAEDASATGHISRNMRRLRLAVYLIASSFVVKAVVYTVLAAGYSSAYAAADGKCPSAVALASNATEYRLRYLCDGDYNQWGATLARSMLGSPLLLPLVALFCDPLLMM